MYACAMPATFALTLALKITSIRVYIKYSKIMKTPAQIIASYAQALRDNDYETIISLFAEDAMVFSFLAGAQPPSVFFKRLFENSSRSKVEVRKLFFEEENGNTVVADVCLDAILDKEHSVTIEAVDIFEFNPENKIKTLRLVLDTHPIWVLKQKHQQQLPSSSPDLISVGTQTPVAFFSVPPPLSPEKQPIEGDMLRFD